MTNGEAECEALVSSVMRFAEEMLSLHGEVYPFGGALRPNGGFVSVAAEVDHEHAVSTDVIRALKTTFLAGARAGDYKATALVYDVSTTLPSTGEMSDAIAVSLNHRDGYSAIVMFPYLIENDEISIGQGFAQKGEADIFPPA